jgi:hypothetical protein
MQFLSLLTVFGLGTIELWLAVPAGLALQVHPAATIIAATLGAILGIVIVGLGGERIRFWLLRRRNGARAVRPDGRITRLWVRYGVIGLGMFAPLLVGAPLGTALGMTFGAPAGRLVFWMSLGAVLCSVSLTLAATLGLLGVELLRR